MAESLPTRSDWRVEHDEHVGAKFILEDAGFRFELYMDGPEWVYSFTLDGRAGWAGRGCKTKLRDVLQWAPGLRDEAVGMTKAALLAERARLAAKLRDALTALAAEDDERVAEVLDDLRTWGTRDLTEELAEAGGSS